MITYNYIRKVRLRWERASNSVNQSFLKRWVPASRLAWGLASSARRAITVHHAQNKGTHQRIEFAK